MMPSLRQVAAFMIGLFIVINPAQAAVEEKSPKLKDYRIDFSKPWDNAADFEQLDHLLNGRAITLAEHDCSISSKPHVVVLADGVVYLNETYTSYDVYSLQAVQALGCKI